MKNILRKSNFGFTKWCVALIAAVGLFSFATLSVQAGPFTAGNLVVLQADTPASSSATTLSLLEYSTSGVASGNSVALPATAAAAPANAALTQSGNATSEGFLNRSQDGRYLIVVGYNAASGTATVASGTADRVVGRIDSSGTVDSTTRAAGLSAKNIRSAVSDNGSTIYVAGSQTAAGIQSIAFGTQPTSANVITAANTTALGIFGGQLYANGAIGTLGRVGSGLPTSTALFTALTAAIGSISSSQSYFLDRDSNVAGVDQCFIADGNSGIKKYSYNGAAWSLQGTITGTFFGLVIAPSGNGTIIYATTGTGTAAANTLVQYTDSAAYNVAGSFGAATTLATAASGKAFRGLAFAPAAAATATSPVVSSFSPASGKVGAAVTITGSNFGSSPTVKFNGVVASSPVVTGGTSIVVNVPTGATTGAISVEVTGETTGTSATSFTVLAPSITTLSPEAGLVGNTVTISGVNLATATSVTFTGASGAIVTTPSAATDTSITVTVPAGTINGNVTVTTASGSSSARFRSLQALILPYGPETFSSGVGSWFFYSAAGAKDWGLGTVGTPVNSFITINGYDASVGAVAADDWAIIGPLDFSAANSFVAEFNIQKSYTNSSDDEIKLKVSRNYPGIGNPASATWSDVPFTKPVSVGNTTANTVFTPVSVFPPSSLAGSSSVYIAFYFKPSATTSGATSTWRVDDFKVTGSTKPLLSITAPTTLGENASSQTGVVSIASAISSNLDVTVTSSDATEILVGQIGGTVAASTLVTIPAGSTSASFKISPAVDGAIDGNQAVTLTAEVADNSYFSGTASVSVLDVDRPGTSLSSSGFTETFSSMGTAGPLPTGWYITSTAGSTYENIAADGWGNGTGSGGRTAPGIFGYQHTGNTGTVTLTLSLQNNTGSPITALTVNFKGRAARLTETRKPVFSVVVAGQANPGLAYDTGYGDNYQMSGGTTGLNIPVGALFQISWASDRDLRNGGSSQQIGLSDVQVLTGFTPTAPSLGGVTVDPRYIADTSASLLGNVTSDGGETVTESGFVYCLTSQSSTPTIGGDGVVKNVFAAPGIGILYVEASPLLPSNSYTVRAYAINSIGTNYSAPTSFTTMAPNPEFTSGYTQNFNGFDSMATIPAGWKCLSTGGANSYIASWPSASASAGFYGETSRPGVLGFTHTSTSGANNNTLTLVNRSGGTLTNLYVSYMGEVTQINNERCPSWVVNSTDANGTTEVTELAYSTLGGTNATKTAQITGLSIANGATYSLTWTSDRGLVQTNGSSRRIGIGFVQIATTAAAIVSNAPVISSPATLSATVGVPVSYQIAASESPTGFWAQNIPSGLTLNASSGVISGTLLSTNANASTMVVTAYNAAGVGNQNVVLTVDAPVKTSPTLTVAPSPSAITVGQALSDSTLTGGSASVAGAFAWTTPSTVPAVGTSSYEVTFSPTDTVNYNTFTTTLSVTVNKITSTISVAPIASAITEGQALSDSVLSGGTASVSGAFAWTAPSTVPLAGTASYEVTFTPTDTVNYSTAATTVSLTVNPAGTTYSGWLNGASASDAAFLDYVFGATAPGALAASLKPTVAVTGGKLVLTYYVRQGTVGLTVTPKASANLALGSAGWSTVGVDDTADVSPITVNGVSVWRHAASVPVSGLSKFLRIEAVQQ